MEYVTVDELAAMLGTGADPERVDLAVTAANQLIGHWVEPVDVDNPPAEPTAAQRQAGRELSRGLYARHAATGGIFTVDDLVARLPADLVRPIRDLLEADTHLWGVG